MSGLEFNPSLGVRFRQPPAGDRDWYAYEAIRALPRILLMVDKNPYSDTHGCFDREYWHYRTADFPCGMHQELVLPLALAYAHPFVDNPYHGMERLKELAVAGMEFARKASHADGSCDDYFPFERALGALVFSTYAMTEAYQALHLERPDLVAFFRLRADWLIGHNETGQLANHQALAALMLYNVYLLTADEKYAEASRQFRDLTLSWQHEEGWFQEYEGADPGYHSCTIAFLAKLWRKSADDRLLAPLQRAVEFAAYFMHPDGSYGGEYGSRNTYHFYPHGFEVLSRFSDTAARVVETYLHRALPERRRYFNDDDRMCAHYVYDWMQAYLDYNPERKGQLDDHRPAFTRWFPGAKLLVKKTPSYYAVVSAAKGGVLKVFDEHGPLYSDTGLIAKTSSGDVLVSHLVDEQFEHSIDADHCRISVAGNLSRRRQPLPSPTKQLLFRSMNLTVGRVSANLVRSTLQRVLITGKPRTGVRFGREIRLTDAEIVIQDTLSTSDSGVKLERLSVGSDATSIYVANSNNFQESTLLPWVNLDEHAMSLTRSGSVVLPERVIRARGEGVA